MKHLFCGVSALGLMLAAGGAHAAGLDRSGQSVAAIFAPENTVALSFGFVNPNVTGDDAGGTDYDIGESYTVFGMSYTNAVNDKFNYSLIFDQPYGTDIDYDANPLTSTLGGTSADLNSSALTFVGRYRATERLSFFAGIKAERVDADVSLNGTAYNQAISTAAVTSGFNGQLPAGAPTLDSTTLGAALAGSPEAAAAIDTRYGAGTTQALGGQFQQTSTAFGATGGYEFEMEQDTKPGYLVGMAYEIPDIALRFAATYAFEIEHEAETTERLLGQTIESDIDYVTPASLNLEFQTGIAEGTLLLASYRWTDFSAVNVVPTALNSDLVNLDDGHRYTLGIGRQFSDAFSGSATIIYEPQNNDDTVTPLGPTDGLWGLTLGGQVTQDNFKFSGGINYSWVGDADAGVGGRPVASFEDNHAVGIGLRAEMTF